MALRKLAVEINSIVRVILRMLRIDLRRRSSALALAMGERGQGSAFQYLVAQTWLVTSSQ